MRIYRWLQDGSFIDAFMTPIDLMVLYDLKDSNLPLVCPLIGIQAPRGADYIAYDKDGWWFAHDTGRSVSKMSVPLPNKQRR